MSRISEAIAPLYAGFPGAAWRNAETLVELAFAEDLGTSMPGLRLSPETGRIVLELVEESERAGDITALSTIPANAHGAATFVARKAGVIAGLPVAHLVAGRFGVPSWFRPLVQDGTRVDPGTPIASISGPMRELLMMERTALNFLQRLSGIATLTARFVAEVAGTNAQVLDTRKTTPGWRILEKYAVRCGGGTNHRMGLHDQVLIKDNHLAWLDHLGNVDPIATAVASARERSGGSIRIEVEVDTLEQLEQALACRPDIILVDNLGVERLAEAVRRRDAVAPGILLEASGGISLETVAALARTGVDRISVGALTHSAPALDIALDYDRSSPT